METSHQPTSRGLPQPIRGLLVNQAPAHKESDTLGFDSPYAKPYLYQQNHKVECNVHVKKVAAGRNQLAGLIKPQNHILQFVFVPTNSEWTAVFGPCSFPQSTKLPGIAEFSYDLALQQEITPQIPYYISIEHEPWVDNTDETFSHRAGYGMLRFSMRAIPSKPYETYLDCYVYRCLTNETAKNSNGRWYRYMRFLSDQTEPFKDYGFDFDSLPKVTEFPEDSFTDEHARIMWSQFGEKQVEDILAPLGVSPYDDAFYGAEGYLVRLTPAQVGQVLGSGVSVFESGVSFMAVV